MMTDAVPLTLKVNIYERSYNIRYPSNQRVQELQVEFATLCKGRKKTNSNRRYFVCIHCGKDDFTNKLRLNQHRYEDGCDAATYSDGEKALLLPYPDFKPGQGKMVEVMGKVRPLTVVQEDVAMDGGRVGHNFDSDDKEGADAGDTDVQKVRCQTVVSSSVTSCMGSSPRPLVPPPPDMFFGPVPPKVRKTVARLTSGREAGRKEMLGVAHGEAVPVFGANENKGGKTNPSLFGANLKKGGKTSPPTHMAESIVPGSLASASAVLHGTMPAATEPSLAIVQTPQQSRLVLEPIVRATRLAVQQQERVNRR